MIDFTRLLTAAAILAHATVGCCAHEVHSADGEVVVRVICHHDHDHGHAGHHHAAHHYDEVEDDFDHENPEPYECSHAKCQWFAPEMRGSDQLRMQNFTATLQESLLCSASVQMHEGSSRPANAANLSVPALPVRAHLVYCVLLI